MYIVFVCFEMKQRLIKEDGFELKEKVFFR